MKFGFPRQIFLNFRTPIEIFKPDQEFRRSGGRGKNRPPPVSSVMKNTYPSKALVNTTRPHNDTLNSPTSSRSSISIGADRSVVVAAAAATNKSRVLAPSGIGGSSDTSPRKWTHIQVRTIHGPPCLWFMSGFKADLYTTHSKAIN